MGNDWQNSRKILSANVCKDLCRFSDNAKKSMLLRKLCKKLFLKVFKNIFGKFSLSVNVGILLFSNVLNSCRTRITIL